MAIVSTRIELRARQVASQLLGQSPGSHREICILHSNQIYKEVPFKEDCEHFQSVVSQTAVLTHNKGDGEPLEHCPPLEQLAVLSVNAHFLSLLSSTNTI